VFSLIIPSSWLGSGPILKKNFLTPNKKIKNNITFINRDECKKHFPSIGSTFSYFVIEKKDYVGKTTIVSKNIDEVSFASQEAHTYSTWKSMFEQVHAASFTEQKKFKLNQIRRKFLLKTEK
jgi:hypothetical protein